MDFLLIVLLIVIFSLRLFWLYFYKTSANIGFILPFIFECLFVYPYFLVDLLGLEWSFFGVLTMFLFSLSLQLGLVLNLNESSKRVTIKITNKMIYIVYILLAFVYVGILSNHLDALHNLSSVTQVLIVANQNAISRYDSTLNVTLIYKISTVFSFLLSLLIGVLVAVRKERKFKFLLVVFFIILFIDSVLMAARAGLLLQLFAFLASFIATNYLTNKKGYYSISFSKVLAVLLFFVSIYLFFIIVQIARGGKEEFDILSISSHVLTWFIGYLSAFDIWVRQYYLFEHTFGLRTFSGIADVLNIYERSGGVYEPVEIVAGRVTNIYTAYRGLIEDFTLPMSFLLLFCVGMLISICIRNVLCNTKKIYYPILIMLLYFIFWSFVINPYIYNSILLAMVCFIIIICKYVKVEKNDKVNS
ncbi:O-antigen polymerase [Shewanella mangrovisoli]|uniref:O-antigen polymerase n=1 Tax=Shewanella mangrovisoli TaxID=2864211 RepID=A0ABV4VFZ2_9GAMM